MAAPIALAAAAVFGWAPKADAGFQVTLSANGFSTTIVDGGSGDFDMTANNMIGIVNQVVGGYSFTFVLETTNTPNSGGQIAFVNNSVGSISNVSGGTGPTTVSIYASANGFVSPTAPPPLTAQTGSTVQYLNPTPGGQTANVSVTSYYDQTNALSTSAAGTVMGNASGMITSGGSNNNATLNDSQTVSLLSSPYTVNLMLEAVLNTSTVGATAIDLDGTVSLSAVPEPSALVAALAGLPLVGGYWLRRRGQKRPA